MGEVGENQKATKITLPSGTEVSGLGKITVQEIDVDKNKLACGIPKYRWWKTYFIIAGRPVASPAGS